MIKFIIDEDIPRSTGKVLKEQGYDVRDIRDYGLRGAEDDKIYEFAQKEEMKLTNFEQLEAWQQVRKLAKVIYQFVKKQNFSKDFRLVNQTTGETNVKCGDLTPPIKCGDLTPPIYSDEDFKSPLPAL